MKEIYITDREYRKATPFSTYRHNVEASIFEIQINGKIRIYKEYEFGEEDLLENKIYTVTKLNEFREILPSGFVIPDTIVHHGYDLGLISDKIDGDTLDAILDNNKVSLDVKIEYLRKVGQLLKQLDYMRKETDLKTFYINDLHEGNFIIDKKGELRTIDLDSSRICDNLAFGAKYINPYSLAGLLRGKYNVRRDGMFSLIVPDEQTDLHCYNMMILSFLYGGNIDNLKIHEVYEFLDYLSESGFNKELIDNFTSVVSHRPNTNPEELLSTLDYAQVGKAKVYKKLKKED